MKKTLIVILQISMFCLFENYLFAQNNLEVLDQFTEQTSISLTGVGYSSVAWGDYDNDGDLDLILTGDNGSNRLAKIYRNNGNNTFTDQTSIVLSGVDNSSVSWGDYDNDGDLDILLSGQAIGGTFISKIYRSNGNNTFTEMTSMALTGVTDATLAWGDYDNDGDLDILLTGRTNGGGSTSEIYRNNGNSTFTLQTSILLTHLLENSAAWGDYDNDGDLDIILTGLNGSIRTTKLYKNNGDNSFTEQTSINLAGVAYSSVAWGDYDNDGDLDLLLTGDNGSSRIAKIYRNNGNSTFTEQTSIVLSGVDRSSVAWGDYDNDGDLDILLSGQAIGGTYISKIYRNNADNTFTEVTQTLTGVADASVAWGDYDNDGDLDIILTGQTNAGIRTSKLYQNNNAISNSLPSSPTNLTSTIYGQDVTFNWNKSTDNETPQNGLRYNLVIGTTPSGLNTLSPMSNRGTGFRKIVRLGNSQTNSWTIKGLANQTYYWSVQAIDNAFAGSNFATEKSFNMSQQSSGIIVNSPNGGEEWPLNSSQNIEWTSENVELVKIEISRNNGTTWAVIDTALESTGIYTWIVNGIISNQCRIKISDNSNNQIFDISDSPFRITPIVGVEDEKTTPKEFSLAQNYPNPFNPTTKIRYQLPQESKVVIKIYNILGSEVMEILNEQKDAGIYEIEFNSDKLSSGTYIYKIITDNFVETKKMLLMK